ncbi:bifunctional hydroxymethylpyrimidine kinase/phosphomethylpyrimidine kinase [Aeribacillus sp. FSL K6-8394]|uniref:bifunctional hydroxymethylpyrimidine kinase/phosphomethylpyrimidine kinase n=1 Tax=Aeribacillus sp. FSL K6-8394 TaxID=2954570 RepID=UPI0030F9A490
MAIGKALTIAGSDSGGGAGIQADLKTFQELDVYGMSVITAVTSQNTLGVHGVYPVPIEGVISQLDAIAEDLSPDAVKTGMLFNQEIIQTVSNKVQKHGWEKIVVDPVMIAKGGHPLLEESAINALINDLIPLSFIVTPNIPEAEAITGIEIKSFDDRKEAAKKICQMGAKHVIIKGGHQPSGSEIIDLLFDGHDFYEFKGNYVNTKHTHGTGCTFSAALTAELAKGKDVIEAVKTAKEFIHLAVENALGIGGGHGPTNHWAYKRNLAASK